MLATLLLLIAVPTEAFTGKVVGITDGDTIVVLSERKQIKVRLEGIDCPESGQAFGSKAKKATSDLAFGKEVTVKVTGKDRYDRTLAHVILPDGTELNRELVRQGFAWWFRKYSTDQSLGKLEDEAQTERLGLWAGAKPVAPWDWRAAQRAKADVPVGESEIVSNGLEIEALLPNPIGDDAGKEQVILANSTKNSVDLTGWKLVDRAGNVFVLSGAAKPGERLVITMTEATMPLNNDGDDVLLLDAEGVGRSRVSYTGSQATPGTVIRFGR